MIDNKMGSQTFETFKTLSNAGYGCKLMNGLSDLREIEWEYETDRNNHYRFNC